MQKKGVTEQHAQRGVDERDCSTLMTDCEFVYFVNIHRGSLKKDLKRHRAAILFIWLFGRYNHLCKFDLPRLYAWVERLEKIKNLTSL